MDLRNWKLIQIQKILYRKSDLACPKAIEQRDKAKTDPKCPKNLKDKLRKFKIAF